MKHATPRNKSLAVIQPPELYTQSLNTNRVVPYWSAHLPPAFRRQINPIFRGHKVQVPELPQFRAGFCGQRLVVLSRAGQPVSVSVLVRARRQLPDWEWLLKSFDFYQAHVRGFVAQARPHAPGNFPRLATLSLPCIALHATFKQAAQLHRFEIQIAFGILWHRSKGRRVGMTLPPAMQQKNSATTALASHSLHQDKYPGNTNSHDQKNSKRHPLPGDPARAQLLIRRLWSALEAIEGRRVTNQELGDCLPLSDTALGDWTSGTTNLYQIEALLNLSECRNHHWCATLFRQHLRVFPSLSSPQLSEDPVTVGRLRILLRQASGLTFICGGNDTQRTFCFAALGHTYANGMGPSQAVAGWDIHATDWLVPVPGLLYFGNSERATPGLLREEGLPGLIMSNGLWERFPSHRSHLLKLSRVRHVVVAEAVPMTLDRLRSETQATAIPLHVLEIASGADRLNLFLHSSDMPQ